MLTQALEGPKASVSEEHSRYLQWDRTYLPPENTTRLTC
jgi:hypothetical protein